MLKRNIDRVCKKAGLETREGVVVELDEQGEPVRLAGDAMSFELGAEDRGEEANQ